MFSLTDVSYMLLNTALIFPLFCVPFDAGLNAKGDTAAQKLQIVNFQGMFIKLKSLRQNNRLSVTSCFKKYLILLSKTCHY